MKRFYTPLFEADKGGGVGGAGESVPAPETESQGSENNQGEKMFTRAELAGAAKSQVEQALSKFKDDELPSLLKSEYEKGKQEAGMSEQEKAEQAKSEHERELDEREAKLNKREAVSATQSLLADKALPSGFADFLASTDEDQRTTRVNEFADAFNKAVQEAVLKKTEGKREQVSGNPLNTGKTDEGSFGKRLAQSETAQSETKSHFF